MKTEQKPETTNYETNTPDKIRNYIATMLTQKTEPNKWYGTCYGRELLKETGAYQQ